MKLNKAQLIKGIKLEMEHTKSRIISKHIAEEHLKENPNYYKQATLRKGYIHKLVAIKKKTI